MLHTFDGSCYMKNEKYMEKCDCNNVFHIFLVFHVAGSIESMQHGGTPWMKNQILHPTSFDTLN